MARDFDKPILELLTFGSNPVQSLLFLEMHVFGAWRRQKRTFPARRTAGAASLDYVKFQAVIKSAASAASREPKSREGSSRGEPRGRRPPAEPPSCTPLGLASLDLGFLEAALAVDLIKASNFYGIRGGCASSRLIHGLASPNNSRK